MRHFSNKVDVGTSEKWLERRHCIWPIKKSYDKAAGLPLAENHG
jgi:hypothetical protein